jgi:hypothetical protein
LCARATIAVAAAAADVRNASTICVHGTHMQRLAARACARLRVTEL